MLTAILVLLGLVGALPVRAAGPEACPSGDRAGLVLDFGAVDDPLAGPRPVPALTWTCVTPLRGASGPAVSGLDLLTRTGHTLRTNASGLVCAIDGYPAEGCAETLPGGIIRYWSYWLHEPAKGPGWAYAGIGPAGRRPTDGTMDGWRYVETRLGDVTPRPRQAPDWDVVCCASPPVGLPQPPATVTATAGLAAATVSWSASTGPNPVTGYVVEAAPSGARTRVDAGVTSATVRALTPGRSYTFTVRALNGAGESAPSAASNPVVPAAPDSRVPGAPTAVSARGGVREAIVGWTAPTSDGGSPVTGYRVEVIPGGRVVEVTVAPARITGLAPGDAYTFVVRAVNAAGVSEPSAASAPVVVTAADPRLVPGRITTVAGTGTRGFTGDGGPAAAADLARPGAVATDAAGNVFVVDAANQRVRRIDAAKRTIATVAGNGIRAFAGDGGAAVSASLRDPSAVAVAPNGDLYIADTGSRRIRRVAAADGLISTVMGTGAADDTGDGGPAVDAALVRPVAVAVGPDGAVLALDAGVGRIRSIDPARGIVTGFAGRGGDGYGGDGGPATETWFAFRAGSRLAISSAGEVYVADTGNARLRRIGVDGIVTTVAGGGPQGAGGPTIATESVDVAGVAVGPDGRVYVSETGRIRVLDPTTGTLTAFAGNGTPAYAGDGLPATTASVYGGSGLAVDASGHVYLTEPDAQRVRRVTGPDALAPVVALTSTPPAEGSDRQAAVAFTVDDPAATVTCALDQGEAAPCTSPWRGEGLAVGPHTLRVSATDPADNTGSADAIWKVVPPATDDPTVTAAAAWLSRELARGDGVLSRAGVPDPGLTTDALLALSAVDPHGATAARVADRLAATATDYVTWDARGKPGVLLAGPLAKLTLALAAQGRDVTSIGGRNADAELRALMTTTGADAGRFADRNPHAPDNANTFGQAYAVLALARSEEGVPDAAIRYLLSTQCGSGGYRLMPGTPTSCTADTDTSALVVQALLTVPRTPPVAASLTRAVGWLLSKQDAAVGAFGGTGPTAAVNANSTGLIAQTLAAVGQRERAGRAADWIRSMALIEGDDAGALAYNADALADARAHGIDDVTRDQWHRSTPQAILGLGLPVFGHIGVGNPTPIEPVVPGDPGPDDPGPGGPNPGGPGPHDRPTALASPTSVRPGERVTVRGSGFGPGMPVTATVGGARIPIELPQARADFAGDVAFTWTVPHDAAGGSYTLDLVDQGNGDTARAGFEVVTATRVGGTGSPSMPVPLSKLPRTGTDPAPLIALALAATTIGTVLRRRARPHDRSGP
ncbi:hypothetical protein B4N89_26810 [Embleya scabrispora]|uniref:Fibronectin type-III domain-containing protein n=1 Tax=Embleya scabrispora TaxID=159449 RepID=A0A1T3P4N4_9ACTN|nr:hypothetical protein B4N89_26810 [Embleya scabrispora]